MLPDLTQGIQIFAQFAEPVPKKLRVSESITEPETLFLLETVPVAKKDSGLFVYVRTKIHFIYIIVIVDEHGRGETFAVDREMGLRCDPVICDLFIGPYYRAGPFKHLVVVLKRYGCYQLIEDPLQIESYDRLFSRIS